MNVGGEVIKTEMLSDVGVLQQICPMRAHISCGVYNCVVRSFRNFMADEILGGNGQTSVNADGTIGGKKEVRRRIGVARFDGGNRGIGLDLDDRLGAGKICPSTVSNSFVKLLAVDDFIDLVFITLLTQDINDLHLC